MQSKLFVLGVEELTTYAEDNIDNKNLNDLIENTYLEKIKELPMMIIEYL